MTISVALCTYNGARYLPAQLASIAAETRLPDEVVVCDDGSQDETGAIIRAFAAAAPFPVRFTENPVNLGTAANFAQAIGLCRGEIIALSDQDDQWEPEKLARLEHVFQTRPEIGLAFSDARLMGADGAAGSQTLFGQTLFGAFELGEAEMGFLRSETAFSRLLRRNVVTGAALAFRGRFVPLVLPIPFERPLLHDAWIALLISAFAPLEVIQEPLISYRLHPHQQTHVNAPTEKIRSADHYNGQLRQLQALARRISAGGPEFGRTQSEAAQTVLRGRIRHLEARVGLPALRGLRLPVIFNELATGRYHQYSGGFRSALRDLL